MSHLPALVLCAALFFAAACGNDTGPISAGAPAGVTLLGQMAWLPIPQTEATKSFSPFTAQFVARDALISASGNDLTYLSDALTVPGTGASCAMSGCAFQVGPVNISGTTNAVFAIVAGAGADTQSRYVPTASMMLNNNQLIVYGKKHVPAQTQSRALTVSTDGLSKLASLTGTDANTLLARGVSIGYVASSRSFSSGAIPGEQAALVTLVNAPAGASVVYVSDDFQTVSRNGTNASGAFVVVGPTTPAADGAGVSIGVNVTSRSSSGVVWPNQSIIVRPNMVVTMPILPTP